MTWFASTDNQSAAEAAHVEVVAFVMLDFPSGALRVHTRNGTIVWGSYAWIGIGQLGKIGDISEDAQLRPSGVTLTLSGVDPLLTSAALAEAYHGRAVAVYYGLFNPATLALVADPELVFQGLMDKMSIEVGQNTGAITVQCESELARWDRHNSSQYTHESQQALWPDDRGFDQMVFIQSRKIDWSKQSSFFSGFAGW